MADLGGGGGLSRSSAMLAKPPRKKHRQGHHPLHLSACVRNTTLAASPSCSTLNHGAHGADKAHVVQLLGAHAQTVILTAPVNADGSLAWCSSGKSGCAARSS